MGNQFTKRVVTFLSKGCIVSCVRLLRMCRLLDWRVINREALPEPGMPLIFVSNHIDWHDIPLVGWAISAPHTLWWFAKAELLGHWMGWWFHLLPMIPVQRGKGDTTAIQIAIKCVATNSPLVIFPEGTWDDGRILRAKTGAVRIAQATGALIVPLGLTGRLQPLWFHTRTITVGQAFRITDLPSYVPGVAASEQPMTDLTTDLMHRITALLPAEYHGYYAATGEASAIN